MVIFWDDSSTTYVETKIVDLLLCKPDSWFYVLPLSLCQEEPPTHSTCSNRWQGFSLGVWDVAITHIFLHLNMLLLCASRWWEGHTTLHLFFWGVIFLGVMVVRGPDHLHFFFRGCNYFGKCRLSCPELDGTDHSTFIFSRSYIFSRLWLFGWDGGGIIFEK